MKAGEDLDRLVAEKIFGLRVRRWPHFWSEEHTDERGQNWVGRLQPYSTDIAAAWQVVEKLDLLRDYVLYRMNSGRYAVMEPEPLDDYAQGDTAPHAICLAALKAAGWTKDTADA